MASLGSNLMIYYLEIDEGLSVALHNDAKKKRTSTVMNVLFMIIEDCIWMRVNNGKFKIIKFKI